MAKNDNITYDTAHKLINYNPLTGRFMWKTRTSDMFISDVRSANHKCNNWNSRYAGKPTGFVNNSYVRIFICGKFIQAHRLAWLMSTGSFPENEIDHKDGDRTNNRIDNLREATRNENTQNTCKRRNNASGDTGVSWDKINRKWRAQLNINGKHINIGRFITKEEAREAYLKCKQNHHTFQPVPREIMQQC